MLETLFNILLEEFLGRLLFPEDIQKAENGDDVLHWVSQEEQEVVPNLVVDMEYAGLARH